MFENYDADTQKNVLEAYQKAAKEIGDEIINKGFDPENLPASISEVVEKLNKKYFFSME